MKKSIGVFALLLTVLFSTNLFAQEKEENHHVGEPGKGPHKGTIQEADPYHAELLVKDGKAYLYLLTDEAKPMSNTGITASAVFQLKDASSVNVTLTASGKDGFVANNDKIAGFTNCIATFKVKGKSVSAKFKNAAAPKTSATATAKYSCPMHPEVKSDKPGKCSKCGMALVETKASAKTETKTMAKYNCPMHPEVVSDKPGKCSKCGMDLMKVKE